MSNLERTLDALRNSNMVSAFNEGRKTVGKNIENTPISCNLLQQNGSKIIIQDGLIEKLAYIKSTISRQKNTGKIEELPFAMMGYKDEQGNVIINDIVYDAIMFEERLDNASAGSLDTATAVFDENISQKMVTHLQRKDIEHPIVIHGHTHPQHLGVSENLTNNFSLGDMEGYQQFQTSVQRVNPNAEVFGMVVNEIGDFNVVEYNSQENTFERVNQVMVGDVELPSFSEGHYLVNSELQQDKERKLLGNRQQLYKDLVNQNQLEPVGTTPKIEKVTSEEIKRENYVTTQKQTFSYKKPKGKSLFSRIKDFIGKEFVCNETNLIGKSIRDSRSIANTNFGKKLAALKIQDRMNGIQIGDY